MAVAANVINEVLPHASVNHLLEECVGKRHSPSYVAKMMHKVDEVPVVPDRRPFIADLCQDHVILDVGASGVLHDLICVKAKKVYGIDLQPGEGVEVVDLDDPYARLPAHPDVTRIVASEIIEHLSNPGFLLTRLRSTYPSASIVVSVPNAFAAAANHHIKKGVENVNRDHVAWYSPKTLEWLLARHGYRIRQWAWHYGKPYTAEGIIALAEPA